MKEGNMGIEKKIQGTDNHIWKRSLAWDDWIPVYGFVKDEYNYLHNKPTVDNKKELFWTFYQEATVAFTVVLPLYLLK